MKSNDNELIQEIYNSINTIIEAENELLTIINKNEIDEVIEVTNLIAQMLVSVNVSSEVCVNKAVRIDAFVISVVYSLKNIIQLIINNKTKKAIHKIEFELIPLTEELRQRFYFYNIASNDNYLLEQYYKKDIHLLGNNKYIEKSLKSNEWKYDLSIVVMAYNKLEYTKQCVNFLLKYYPRHLRTELILINHGSTDGTKEYFESLSPDKQLDIKINGGGSSAIFRITEGKYILSISNDVFVQNNSIKNMYECITSDPKIGYIVPTTPNVSNLQTIECTYSNTDELEEFAENNNISDYYRWEERVRLCNPISMVSAECSLKLKSGYWYNSTNQQSFPDDRLSLLCRRNNYKMYLCKDAFCHHCGSVTLKDDKKINSNEAFLQGRIDFKNTFGIDPWGTGFCYNYAIFKDFELKFNGHINILGINCGMGSNSLKIKELYKEHNHNTDVSLINIEQKEIFIKEMALFSDDTIILSQLSQLSQVLNDQKFQYIVFEDPFNGKEHNVEDIEFLSDYLVESGELYINTFFSKLCSKYTQTINYGEWTKLIL